MLLSQTIYKNFSFLSKKLIEKNLKLFIADLCNPFLIFVLENQLDKYQQMYFAICYYKLKNIGTGAKN